MTGRRVVLHVSTVYFLPLLVANTPTAISIMESARALTDLEETTASPQFADH